MLMKVTKYCPFLNALATTRTFVIDGWTFTPIYHISTNNFRSKYSFLKVENVEIFIQFPHYGNIPRKLFPEIQYLLNKQPRFSDFLHPSIPLLAQIQIIIQVRGNKTSIKSPLQSLLKNVIFFLSKKWVLCTLSENSKNQLTLFCLSPTAVATSSYLVVQNVSGQSLQFGNTGCGVFNGGIQNQTGFWLKIIINKGNH